MEINRNHYFAVGVLLLLLGIQFRYIESFTLNETTSRIVREKIIKKRNTQLVSADQQAFTNFFTSPPLLTQQLVTIKPPSWIGWALLSSGGVLVLHSLAMQRPE